MFVKIFALLGNRLCNIKYEDYFAVFVVAWLLIFPAVLPAQELLTLDKVWDLALHNNLALQQQVHSIEQANKEIWIQQTGLLPALSLTSYYQYQSELARIELPFMGFAGIEAGVHNQYDLHALIQQPVFRGFRTYYSVRAAKKKYELQIAQKTVQQNVLLLQAVQLFFDLQLNFLRQEVLQKSIERTALQLERLDNLLAARQISPFDTLEIANHKLDQLNRLQLIRDQQKILHSKLEYLLDIPELPAVQHRSATEITFTLKPLNEYQTLAMEKRPELKQTAISYQLQQDATSMIRAAYYPQISAQLAYHYARPGVNYFKDEWMKYYNFGINLQWNLWNWSRDAAKVQQAKLEQYKLDLENQKLVNDIKQQVKEVYLYLQSLIQQSQLLKQCLSNRKTNATGLPRKNFNRG